MRLAWFTPLRPVTSGIADYSADVLPAIGAAHAVEVFVASAAERGWQPPPGVTRARRARVPLAHPPMRPTTSSSTRSATRGATTTCGRTSSATPASSSCTTRSCTTRARGRCSGGSARTTTAPSSSSTTRSADPAAAEIGLAGFSGPVYYGWPMVRAVVTSARAVAVHNGRVASELREAYPEIAVEDIRLGVTDPLAIPVPTAAAADLSVAQCRARRAALGRTGPGAATGSRQRRCSSPRTAA